MKTTFSILLVSAALATAQVKSNPDGTFTCPKANASYCASDKSLDTDIIFRCTGTSAQAGRCGNVRPPFPLPIPPNLTPFPPP